MYKNSCPAALYFSLTYLVALVLAIQTRLLLAPRRQFYNRVLHYEQKIAKRTKNWKLALGPLGLEGLLAVLGKKLYLGKNCTWEKTVLGKKLGTSSIAVWFILVNLLSTCGHLPPRRHFALLSWIRSRHLVAIATKSTEN